MMLGSLQGVVILDEIQVMPELFNVLRVLVDRPENQARFLILGSASPGIIKNVSETLAGRIEFIELSGFDLQEIGADSWERLWLRAGRTISCLSINGYFPQSLRQTQILILKIPYVFLRLKSSSSLTLQKISHFWMGTIS